jgi:hypothetical protein
MLAMQSMDRGNKSNQTLASGKWCMFCCSTPLQLAKKKGHTEVIGLLSRLQENGEALLACS